MNNINTRLLEWCKNTSMLDGIVNDAKKSSLVSNVFCEDQEKRTVASLELYEVLWSAHPELGPCPNVRKLSEFEYNRVFYEKYRDHVSHSAKTFFLGLYLYENNDAMKKSIFLRLQKLNLSEDSKSFILIWTITSLYHDFGYVLENEKVEVDEKLWTVVQSGIDEKLSSLLSSTLFFSDVITRQQESQFINKNKIFIARVLSIADFEDDDLFSELIDFANKSKLSNAGSTKNGIQQYYHYAKSHRFDESRLPFSDHGVVSALILIKVWTAYSEYIDKLTSNEYAFIANHQDLLDKLNSVKMNLGKTKIAVIEAAGSIALHNITKVWKKEDALGYEIDLDNFFIKLTGVEQLPFAFLLRFADELQCWDRSTYCSPSLGFKSIKGSDIDIEVTNAAIYVWFKDDLRYVNPETEPGSKYVHLVSQLGKYLELNAITCRFRTEAKKIFNSSYDKGTRAFKQNEKDSDNSVSEDADIQKYLEFIKKQYSDIAQVYADLNAVETGSGFEDFVLPEARAFVQRSFQANNQLLSHSFENPQNPFQFESFESLFDYFIENQRVALTGGPGSGKSTTLEFAAFKFASMCIDTGSRLVPSLIDLGGMGDESVDAYLAEHIDERIRKLLGTDRLILLLDGFNEVSSEGAANLNRWIADNPNQRLIITCRQVDYIERQLPLKRIDIKPLDLMQIWTMMGKYLQKTERDKLFWSLAGSDVEKAWYYYIERYTGSKPFETFWFGNIGIARSFEKEKSIMVVIQNDLKERGKMPGMLPLLSNPFLLYAAIVLYFDNLQAPNTRRDVLIGFAISMLKKAELKSDLLSKGKYSSIWADLDMKSLAIDSDRGKWLAYCAFKMFERNAGTAVPLSWLHDELVTRFPNEQVKGFIDNLISTTLLEKFGSKTTLVKFRYQIMQEFFAAVHICIISDYTVLSSLFADEEWWRPSVWDETIRIAAELLNNASDLIEALRTLKPDLAFSCIHEDVYCRTELYKELLKPSKTEIPNSPRACAAWGRTLITKGATDTRKGVGIFNGKPDFDWVKINPGNIEVGCENGDCAKLGVAGNMINVKIEDELYISKYPTTRMQFERFLNEGYEDKENWSELGWHWKGTRSYPELWLDTSYNLDNGPVVGVSWFEAMAFCVWATKKIGQEGWSIDLPLEAEWEYAARYSDGRNFPWGNSYLPGLANIDEGAESAACGPFSLGQPTSVGIYSQGNNILGIADLCGNVWEWCKSKWDVCYVWPEIISSETVDHRVIKGGSWYNSIRFAYLGVHDCLDADLGVKDVGFRVVMRKSSEESLNIQTIPSDTSKMTVKKILIMGTASSGRTEFVRSVSDFPLLEVHKKDFSSGEQIQMDYGRHFYDGRMNYFYAPLVADDENLSRFIKEMHGVIFITNDSFEMSDANRERIQKISDQCKNSGLPFLVGVNWSDLVCSSKKLFEYLSGCGVNATSFCALESNSCSQLLDVLFK